MANNGAVAVNPADLMPQGQTPTTSDFRTHWDRGMSIPPAILMVNVAAIPDSPVQLKTPFFVLIEPDGDQFIAKSSVSLIYEVADTRSGALRGYLDLLVDHFEWLTDEESQLAPTLRRELDMLRRYLQA